MVICLEFLKINPGATYIIIDLPVFSFIQSVYLKTILGINNVVIIKNNNDKIQAGKVNIVPLNLEVMVALDFGSIDLFVHLGSFGNAQYDAKFY